jgi:hypothetical protein
MQGLTAEQEAQARQLAADIARAIEEDLLATARLLVSKQPHQAFGDTEFRLRDLLHKAGTRILDTYLAQKKTATRAPQ